MDNTATGLISAGVAKAKAQLVEEDSEMESDGSGDLLDSGEDDVSADEDSSEEDIPQLPVIPVRKQQYSRPRQRNKLPPKMARDFFKQKRKSDALKEFQKFSKRMKLDTGLTIKTIAGGDIVELEELLGEDSDDSYTRRDDSFSSDGFSDPEFTIDPAAGLEPDQGNESFIDPETGDIVVPGQPKSTSENQSVPGSGLEDPRDPDINTVQSENEKTLSICDIINDSNELDLSKNVDIEDILGANEFTIEKSAHFLESSRSEMLAAQTGDDADYDITEKLKEMGEISVKSVKRDDETNPDPPTENGEKAGEAATPAETEEDKNKSTNALNVRRNIREVMDEKQLDASTLAAQRQESERLARVQEQQRIIREVRRQISLGKQERAQARVVSMLQAGNLGGSSVLKRSAAGSNSMSGHKLNLPNTVMVKLPSGEMKKTTLKPGQLELLKAQRNKGNLTPSVSISPVSKVGKGGELVKGVRKDVVEIVDSSSSSSSSESPSSESDDCIMLSDSELPPSPEPEEDPQNSGLHVNDTYNIPDDQGRVVINFGHSETEEDIFLAPQIGRIIKPHQIGGVRFLFDNIIESVERFSTSTGFGCILAHSMGLGKTLQIVCFCDIFLRHTKSKTVLCIMPINTLQNWVAEFNMWLPLDPSASPLNAHGEVRPRNFPIYVLNDSHKTLQARAKVIHDWTQTGGVLMIGYELYRLLSMKKNKKPRNRKKKNDPAEKGKDKFNESSKDKIDSEKSENKQTGENAEKKDGNDPMSLDGSKADPKQGVECELGKDGEKEDKKEEDDETDEDKKLLNEMHDALVKPGPDLVICDEGHRIKNSHSNISYALKQMRTKRRVVLTGYPLQNNLLEYWCMVDFVRPNYLGTKTEFSNMFERPIQNGQCIDSTPQDIRLMRYRAHVLHSLLVGFVQRRSHAVLQTTLPQKEEYVLLVRMTDLQRKLYDTFMNEVVRKKTVPNPLKAFAVCCKIWNHPDVLYYFLKKRNEMAALIDYDLDIEDNANLMKGAINNQQTPITKKGKRATRSTAKKDKMANSGKPAATIPPNTGSAPNDSYHNQYDPTKTEHTNGPQNYGYGGEVPPNNYPPYQGYHQFPPQNNYYGQNDSYSQQPYNSGYYQNQPYGSDYNNQYNQQNPHMAPADGNVPPPQQQNMQHYPQNHAYNPQGYWGSDNNYYNNTDPNYYPPQNPPNYQSNQDPYSSMYDPYAQQTQPYHGFNQNRTNGDGVDPAFGNNMQGSNGTPYQQSSEPVAAPFSNPPNSDSSVPNVYNSGLYPPYQTADAASAEQDTKSSIEGVSSLLWPGGLDEPIKNEPVEQSSQNLLQLEIKNESKADSDGEIKIADLDTMKLINDTKVEVKQEVKLEPEVKPEPKIEEVKPEMEPPVAKVAEDPKKDEKVSSKKNIISKAADLKSKEKADKSKSKKAKDRCKAKDKKNNKRNSKDKGKNKDDESGKESDKDDDSDSKKNDMKEEVPFEWANEILKGYIPGIIENSAKMEILFCVLEESIRLGDRLLLFSQSLFTLNLIEDFLQRNYIPGTDCMWARSRSYYRLDGSTSALEREKLINEFNSNPNIHLFLVSTRAGSLGINLVGANRVIVFDASWNPCHDTQAVCRVYRYGQKKPCFVYRLVMDCCLEKKIYDRQINKQGMADRVVDECNPDAVLSMKEVTNLCWDNDEKESDVKEFKKDCKEKYLDVIMRKVIEDHARTLSKEPFQHESLLVDRKEKKLSSAEKRLAQRGYELEKKAASNPKPSLMYRTIRTADGSLIQRPVASVRPMQHGGSGGARWIPAEVWQRQGMTAQEMTLPLDVVIPTNSSDKSNIVLKAGQKVMVLKSPKGIYMQLETGKIIAIKTSFKVGQNKNSDAAKDMLNKKISPSRPSNASLPGSLKNNSAITVISKSARGGLQKTMTRPNIIQNKIRGYVPGQIVRGIGSGIQNRGFSIIRGTRPVRPVPVQNKVNIKIQGVALSNVAESKDRARDIILKKIEMPTTTEVHSVAENLVMPLAGGELETNSAKEDMENPERAPDGEDSFGSASGVLRPNLPEDLASEDSSQEKTYADLSDRGESKITTQSSVKRFPVRPIGMSGGSILKDCKIPIKNSYLHADQAEIGFMNQVTIKRTTVPSAAPLVAVDASLPSRPSFDSGPSVINLLSDETFPSEAVLAECRPSASLSAVLPPSDDSTEDDVTFTEKKVYKPNLIDRKVKINSLKNYRHPKMMIKQPMAGEVSSGAGSPAGTPTPPPCLTSVPSPLGTSKTPPDKMESSLARLEKTASAISSPRPGGVSDFRQTLSDITRTYSPDPEVISADKTPYRPGPKSRKKKIPPTRRTDSPEMRARSVPTPEAVSNESGTAPAADTATSRNPPTALTGGPEVSGYVAPLPGYGATGDNAAPNPGGFEDPSYRQQNPSIDPAAPPQQPYTGYPGYPPASGSYPGYPPAAPYYQPYPSAPYPPYQPQYPPAHPHPPIPYPPANYPPPNVPNAPLAPHPGPYPGYPPYPNPNQW